MNRTALWLLIIILAPNPLAMNPGPYAESEFMLTDFTNWYAGMMENYLDEELENA